MENKILVAYASKYGSTREIAKKIGEDLRDTGLDVDIRPVETVTSIDLYQTIIFGSAVYIGKWLKEAEVFLKANVKPLSERSVWLFSSGPSGDGDPKTLVDGALVPTNLKPVIDQIHPRQVTLFHGNIDPNKVNPVEKWAVKSVVKKPFGDYRDWQMIRSWTDGIASTLRSGVSPDQVSEYK